MGLAELAAGVTVTDEQRERGIATVDRSGDTLSERLEECQEALPTDPDTAAAILERYAAGGSIGDAAAAGDVAPITAAKTLHLAGESVSPLGPTGRAVVRDWIAGDVSRSTALELSRASPGEFALAAYVETHEPLEAALAALDSAGEAAELTHAADEALADVADVPDRLR
ncbi:MAG: hypothetical protein ABEH64_08775 [Salinirussus sp.]